MLGGSMRSQATAAWASGVVTVLSPATGALEIAEAGAAALLTLGQDERFDLVLSDAPPCGRRQGRAPLSAPTGAAGRPRGLARSGGRISALADPVCVAKAQHILETLPDRGGPETARSLLSLVCGEGLAAASSVLEVVEAQAEPAGGAAD